MRLPKYWRPAKNQFSTKLNDIAFQYLKDQAEKHDVSQVFWLNTLLTKMAKDKRNFDPRPYIPSEDQLIAVGLEGMTKEAREQAGEINYATVDRKRPKRRRRTGKDFEV